MSTTEEQLNEVEISIEQAKEMIGRRDALHRLLDNADFKQVFSEGLFKKEAERLVMLTGDPEVRANERANKHVMSMIESIGQVRNWMLSLERQGDMAERELQSYQETREEILEEQLTESTVQ